MINFKGVDVLSAKEFSKEDILKVIGVADEFLPVAKKEKMSDILKGKVLASLFYEPSTRTRLSFETAMIRLGGNVITVSGSSSSSLSKGETLSDTAKVIEQYADVIAVRHSAVGAPKDMADGALIPVLNAGDGTGEHPTQALLDVFTINSEVGKLDGITVAMVGDLRFGRTVHSLAYLLSNFDVKIVFVAPDFLQIPQDVKDFLEEKGIEYEITENLFYALKVSDVLYMTRIQRERFPDATEYEKLKGVYVLSKKLIEENNSNIVVLHPLPRVDEISVDVDSLNGAAYFRQVRNGVAVRMALLKLVIIG